MSLLRLVKLSLLVCCGVAAAADDSNQDLAVVTYNIRYANPNDGLDLWPNRVDAVAEVIGAHDVVGLQEVTRRQLDQLLERLTEFGWYGVGRDDGKSGGEHAVIFYRQDRIEPVDQGTFWLSENPEQVGVKGWDAALPRTCTWMVLRDKVTDHRFWIANTHFDHRGGKARSASGRLISRVAAQKSGSMPAIVLGDFNCQAESNPYRELTAIRTEDGRPLVDARAASQQPPTGPTSTWNGFQEIADGRIIDHIFVRGPLEVVALATLNPETRTGRFASDHLPVRATIRLRAAPSE